MPDYAADMPEGDALRRAAQRLQVLVGQRVDVETPHPRAAAKHLADRLDGKVLEAVDAVGKNLLLRFEGGLVLQSHLRMTGRWRVEQRGARRVGQPWLVLRGETHEGVLWNGPVLELRRDGAHHPSPNAGRVEAAFAGALGVTLGGANDYDGTIEERPRLGDGPPPD